MKTLVTNRRRLASLATGALIALLAPALNALSQANPPVGMWDCVMSGHGQNGILFLNFLPQSDLGNHLPVFEGVFIQAGQLKVSGAGRDAGSTGSTRSGSGGIITNLFGGGFINGSASGVATNVGEGDWFNDSRGYRGYWAYDNKGRTVGQFYTVLNGTANVTNFFDTCIDEILPIHLTNNGSFNIHVDFCFTNAVLATNFPWSAPDGEVGFTNLTFTNVNFTIGTVGQTNGISFVGKVVPGKRLTMVGTSAFGKFTIRGVPLQPLHTLLPVDGFTWTASKVQNGFKSVEEFQLAGAGGGLTNASTVIPNLYAMIGQGPSYIYGTSNDGTFCLISSQKRIAFFVQEIPFGTAPPLLETRATIGKLVNHASKIGANTTGESTADPNIIHFNAYLSTFPTP
ncbi:MAG TPA: hypothetical protein VH597_01555 [Verrucomicrobiae bacterium]|jgi:hypothetical protein|nr:hypothetical protein [Verrucomicrobiae bacterium]